MDARVRYTKFIIKKTMLEMLQTVEVKRITVKEICEKAEINRATFYKYYDNPYDLLNKMEAELLEEMKEKISERGLTRFSDLFHVILTEIRNNSETYQVLFSQNGDGMFKEKVFDIGYQAYMNDIKTLFPRLNEKYQSWLYYMIAEGCNGVLNQWMKDGMTEPIEDVVRFLERIIISINRGADSIK